MDDHTAKFPVGTRVKLISFLWDDGSINFQFGGNKTTIPSRFATVKSNQGWEDSYKSCKILVQWDSSTGSIDIYSMLEKEFELVSGTELRDIPGIHKFKVDDLVRVKAGVTGFIYGGSARGNAGDCGYIFTLYGFDRDKKCMKVGVKFDDSRTYTMSEDELELKPIELHKYVAGDVVRYKSDTWLIIESDSTGVILENSGGTKLTVLNKKYPELVFTFATTPLLRIRVGQFLRADYIETYSHCTGGLNPVGAIPKGATVKIIAVSNLCDITGKPYRSFSFEYHGKSYDATLGRNNSYSLGSASTFVSIISTSCIPNLGTIYSGFIFEPPAPEKKVDPRNNREKYIGGSDPFVERPTPTKDLEIKKEKKFSL